MSPAASAFPTVSLISLGCPRTLVDSELLLGRLSQQGFRVVETVERSDVLLINTCSFVQDAIQESIETILQAVELKRRGRLKAVVVAGCLVQRFKEELVTELAEVDGFVGVDGFEDIETVVQRALHGERPQHIRTRPQVPHQGLAPRAPLSPAHSAYLKISEGCLKGCSFCIIPKIKGPLASRPLEAVVEEARRLVEERGARELIVVGQDTSDYGVDRYGRPRIAELLARLGEIAGVRWIRLLYCHPRGISQELIETIRDEPAVCKYLDMAIEHADDDILARMNRGLTQAALRERIARLRAAIPGIALRTSVIVGFPGETEAAFERLLDFLREVRFERLGGFRYSPEAGTASVRFPDQVPTAAAQERLDRLMRQQQAIAAELNAGRIGQTVEVLIDEAQREDPCELIGRTSADCPEVDGSVFVRSPRPMRPGAFVPVRITDSTEHDLIGVVADASAAQAG
jgi:ribosomal protein S12 methylthiotransferase